MPSENLTKGEEKRRRFEEAIGKKKRKKTIWIVGIIIVAALLIGAVIWYGKKNIANAPGVFYPDIGRQHLGINAALPTPYNSNPPSSGGHYGSPAKWGIYDYEVNDKIFIHNLEHGGVWIAYRPEISSEAVNDLKAIVDEFGGSKIVMAPRSANDSDVAVAAWTRVFKFDLTNGVFGEQQKEEIRAFYRRFKNRGPEFVPDTMSGVDPKSVQ